MRWQFLEDNWIHNQASPGLTEMRLLEDLSLRVGDRTDSTVFDYVLVVRSGFQCDLMSLPTKKVGASLLLAGIGAIAVGLPWLAIPFIVVLAAMNMLPKSAAFPAGIIHDNLYGGSYGETYRSISMVPFKITDKHRDAIEKTPKLPYPLCAVGKNRRVADRIFRELLIDYAIPGTPRPIRAIIAWGYWLMLRAFGWLAYKKS